MNRETRRQSRRRAVSRAGTGACAMIACFVSTPVLAQLENDARAAGTSGGASVEAAAETHVVQLAAATPQLVVSQALDLDVGQGADPENADAGDILSVTLTVTNAGNVAVDAIVVDGATLSIGDTEIALEAARFAPSSAELGLGETATFSATHVLAADQVFRAVAADGVVFQAGVTGTAGTLVVPASGEPARVAVPAHAQLAISTESTLEKAEGNRGEGAEAGDRITFAYRVENTGNAAIDNVTVSADLGGKVFMSTGTPDLGAEAFSVETDADDPLGLNADAPDSAGVFDRLGAGGAALFTHVHTLSQAEFEAQ